VPDTVPDPINVEPDIIVMTLFGSPVPVIAIIGSAVIEFCTGESTVKVGTSVSTTKIYGVVGVLFPAGSVDDIVRELDPSARPVIGIDHVPAADTVPVYAPVGVTITTIDPASPVPATVGVTVDTVDPDTGDTIVYAGTVTSTVIAIPVFTVHAAAYDWRVPDAIRTNAMTIRESIDNA
jgi:hypothetical protein